MSYDQEKAKTLAARAGAELVRNGMTIGLGSGSTSEILVRELGARANRESLEIRAVATSERTARLAAECGIRLIDPDDVDQIDVVLDGADEVDPQNRMIKGRGGALLREKIVASIADLRIIMADRTKIVAKLGEKHWLPIEIASFGVRWTIERLRPFGVDLRLRTDANRTPVRTDGGNLIVDLKTGPIDDPERLQRKLLSIPGVYETGLFLGLCDILIIGDAEGIEIRRKESPK